MKSIKNYTKADEVRALNSNLFSIIFLADKDTCFYKSCGSYFADYDKAIEYFKNNE